MKKPHKTQNTAICETLYIMRAERKGFEPSKQFPVYTLSRRAPSTTRTPLCLWAANIGSIH